MSVEMETCPASAPFFGFMGVTSALVFANIGAAYGTAKSGVGISSMGVMNPGLVMRNIIPVVMAGVLGIYGLIVAIIIVGKLGGTGEQVLSEVDGYRHLTAGLANGLACWASGWGMAKFVAMLNDGPKQETAPATQAPATEGTSATTPLLGSNNSCTTTITEAEKSEFKKIVLAIFSIF